MELYQLKTFIKVAETGNLTRAASELNASQPSVSAHIKAIEDSVGLALFRRTPRGMELTQAGERLLAKAREIMAGVAEFEFLAANLSQNPCITLNVGLNTDPRILKIDSLVELSQSTSPRLCFNFVSSNSPVILKGIVNGEFDAGFVFGPCEHAELTCAPLTEIKLQLVGPLAWRDQVMGRSLAELARLPWVMPPGECPYSVRLKAEFARLGLTPSCRQTADQEPILKSLVTAGHGLSLLPDFEIKADDALCVWDGPNFTLPLNYVCRTNRHQQPDLNALETVLKRLWG